MLSHVAPEGVFTNSGYFVHIPYVCRLRAVEIWQEKVFTFLVDEGRIDREVVSLWISSHKLRSTYRTKVSIR